MLIAITCLLFSVSAHAVDWYKVEVIVFEQTKPDTDGESWITNPGLPYYKNSTELITEEDLKKQEELKALEEALIEPITEASIATESIDEEKEIDEEEEEFIPYLLLSVEEQRLEGISRALTLSSAYRPLSHIIWQQEGLPEATAKHVHLSRTYKSNIADDPLIFDIYGEPLPGLCHLPPVQFDGMLRIRSAQFLHAEVDVAYFPADKSILLAPNMQQSEEAETRYKPADYVRLKESRRIKFNEINYFDHPLFGVLLQVSKIEKPENEAGN